MDKLGASIDSSLSAATLQISEGSVCLMEIFLGFWQVFYYFAFIFLLLFFFYSPSTEKAKSMTISWCQCSVEYVYSFLSWKFLLCGEEQNNSHQQQSKLKGISNWNNYIILPLTSRLVYPTLQWCRRREGNTLHVFITLLVHISQMYWATQPGSNVTKSCF